jgi:hypothetical protein
MEGGFVERQAMDCGPQIDNVAVGAAISMKALKNALAQMS